MNPADMDDIIKTSLYQPFIILLYKPYINRLYPVQIHNIEIYSASL